MALARPQAMRAHPRVVGDQRGQRGILALDEPGGAAIADASCTLGHIGEQARDGVREPPSTAGGQELGNLVHRATPLDRREELACLELPDEVRGPDRVRVESQAVAALEIRTDGHDLQVGEHAEHRLHLDRGGRVVLHRAQAVRPERGDADEQEAVLPAEERQVVRAPEGVGVAAAPAGGMKATSTRPRVARRPWKATAW